LAVFFIIFAGVSYMLAEGNPEKAAAARKRLINAVVGLVIVMVAIVMVSFVGNTLG
jgi:arginine exporter protein ArgO